MELGQAASASTKPLTRSFGWDESDAFQQHDAQELQKVLIDRLEAEVKHPSRHKAHEATPVSLTKLHCSVVSHLIFARGCKTWPTLSKLGCSQCGEDRIAPHLYGEVVRWLACEGADYRSISSPERFSDLSLRIQVHLTF